MFWLVLLLIVVMPLKRQDFWTGSGGEFTVIKYLGGVCALYAAVYAATTRDSWPRYLETWQARWYLLFTVLIGQSLVQTGMPFLPVAQPVWTVASLLLLGFTLVSVVDSVRRLRWVLLTTIGSLGLASLYVIREWQNARGWETGLRPGWIVGDANTFPVPALTAMPLAWYLAGVSARPGWERWFCRACLILTFVAVILGASRGGFLGLSAAVLFVAIRSQKRVRTLVVLSVLLLSFNVAYPYSPLQRLLHPDPSDMVSTDAHRASWQAGLNMISAHPVGGVGLGSFKSRMEEYVPAWYEGPSLQAHNAYISVAAELGVPGLLIFAIILLASYISLERTYKNREAPRLVTRTAVALQAGLLGSCVSIFFISAEYHQHLWFIVFLSMCLHSIASQYPKAEATGAETAGQDLEATAASQG